MRVKNSARMSLATAATVGSVLALLGAAPSASASASDSVPTPPPIANVTQSGSTETITYADGSVFKSSASSESVGLLAGSFSWTADFQIGIWSRYYNTPNSGTHTVVVNNITNCDSSYNTATLELYRSTAIGQEKIGTTRHFSCSGATLRWNSVPSGEFQWYLRVDGYWGNDPYGRHASGTTSYP